MRRFQIDPDIVDALPPDTEGNADGPAGIQVPLSPADANHVRNVLRLKPGALVRLFDGRGAEFDARIHRITDDGVFVRISRMVSTGRESPASITIAQGFLKDKKMDTLIRQLTELGISRWIPFLAERSVARPDPKRLLARKARWEKIAAESLKQCRRSRIPDIAETCSFDEMIEAAADAEFKVLFWEQAPETALDLRSLAGEEACGTVFAVLGPEGGLSKAEVDAATAAGFAVAGIGPRILRAETATVAACTLLQYFLGDLGKNP